MISPGMKRRNFMAYALFTGITPIIVGCGGGSNGSDGQGNPDSAYDEGYDDGLDSKLSSLPDPIFYNKNELLAKLPASLSAVVRAGSTPLANIPVMFYNVNGDVIGEGVTDAEGLCQIDASACAFNFVKADVEGGALFGFNLLLTPGKEFKSIEVNLYQTVAAKLYTRLNSPAYNILNYVLQDYFDLSYTDDIWDIDAEHENFSQDLLNDACEKSPLGRAAYLDSLVDDIYSHIDDDGYVNRAFLPVRNLGSVNNTLEFDGSDVAEFAWEIGIDIFKEFCGDLFKFPGGSFLFNAFFGRLKKELIPGGGDSGYADIQKSLDLINKKLDNIIWVITDADYKASLTVLESYYNNIGVAHSQVILYNKRIIQFPDNVEYRNKLLELQTKLATDSKYSDELLMARNKFFGIDTANQYISVMQTLMNVLKLKKFHSRVGESLYLARASYFYVNQMKGYALLTAASQAYYKDLGYSDDEINQKTEIYQTYLDEIFEFRKILKPTPVPPAVFIDYTNKKAWCGSGEDIVDWREFFNSQNHFIADPKYPISISEKTIKDNYYGRGTSAGVDNKKYFPKIVTKGIDGRDLTYSNIAGLKFPDNGENPLHAWRLPTASELSDTFLKHSGKKIDVYAMSEGAENSARFVRFNTSRLATALAGLNDKYVTAFPDKNSSLQVNIGTKADFIRFQDNVVHYGESLYRQYDYNKHIYAYFPVADVKDAVLDKVLPWRLYEKFIETFKA